MRPAARAAGATPEVRSKGGGQGVPQQGVLPRHVDEGPVRVRPRVLHPAGPPVGTGKMMPPIPPSPFDTTIRVWGPPTGTGSSCLAAFSLSSPGSKCPASPGGHAAQASPLWCAGRTSCAHHAWGGGLRQLSRAQHRAVPSHSRHRTVGCAAINMQHGAASETSARQQAFSDR